MLVGHLGRLGFGGAEDVRGATIGRDFGEAEVEDLRVSAERDEDVCRFDMAMDDAAGVSCIECIGDLDAKREQFLDGQWTAH
jgi:hypothetical protein